MESFQSVILNHGFDSKLLDQMNLCGFQNVFVSDSLCIFSFSVAYVDRNDPYVPDGQFTLMVLVDFHNDQFSFLVGNTESSTSHFYCIERLDGTSTDVVAMLNSIRRKADERADQEDLSLEDRMFYGEVVIFSRQFEKLTEKAKELQETLALSDDALQERVRKLERDLPF